MVQALPQCLLLVALYKVGVSLLVIEKINKRGHHFFLHTGLQSKKFRIDLLQKTLRIIVRYYLQYEFLATQLVLNNIVLQNCFFSVHRTAKDLVLINSARKPLTNTDQDVSSGKHLPVCQEEKLAVLFLLDEEQNEVPMFWTSQSLILRVYGCHLRDSQVTSNHTSVFRWRRAPSTLISLLYQDKFMVLFVDMSRELQQSVICRSDKSFETLRRNRDWLGVGKIL